MPTIQNNREETLFSSAEYSASQNSADMTNLGARGGVVTIDATAVGLTSEVQSLTVDATGGTFTITYSGQTTAAIAYNASAAAVQAALIALSNLATDDVVVTGGPGDAGGTTPYVLTFGGTLANTDVAQITASGASLTGGAGTATPATTTAGGAAETPSVVFTIKGKDSLSGKYVTLLASAAITATGTTTLRVYPGSTVTANVSANASLPAVWRLEAVAADGDGLTYSASVNYLL